MNRGTGSLIAFAACLAFGCAGSAPDPSELAEVPSAEDLYREGNTALEDGGRFLFIDTRDHAKAIETFQQIVDNYPYSDYAVLAELKIADSYFDQEKYEEALSYYRDFGDLHPQHEQVPYTLQRAALCHYRQSKDESRDQTATRQSLVFLDKLLSKYP